MQRAALSRDEQIVERHHTQQWAIGKLFKSPSPCEASLDLKEAQTAYKPTDMLFAFISGETAVDMKPSHITLEVDISLLNIATSFIPMYFILGLATP